MNKNHVISNTELVEYFARIIKFETNNNVRLDTSELLISKIMISAKTQRSDMSFDSVRMLIQI